MSFKDPPPAYPTVVQSNYPEIGFKNEITTIDSNPNLNLNDIPPIQRISKSYELKIIILIVFKILL